jgi:hypothetical protein
MYVKSKVLATVWSCVAMLINPIVAASVKLRLFAFLGW